MAGNQSQRLNTLWMTKDLTPELLLRAYASGIFPMAERWDDPELFWVDPERRGVFELDCFHISRSLARAIRSEPFTIRTNYDFLGVVDGCADRRETWISTQLRALYSALHAMGHAHSIEVWEGDRLVGGVYGVTLKSAFFGESMFSSRANASKIALAYLVHHLRQQGFSLFDTQFLTPHLASLGAIEISRTDYRRRLEMALEREAHFTGFDQPPSPASVIQLKTQTS